MRNNPFAISIATRILSLADNALAQTTTSSVTAMTSVAMITSLVSLEWCTSSSTEFALLTLLPGPVRNVDLVLNPIASTSVENLTITFSRNYETEELVLVWTSTASYSSKPTHDIITAYGWKFALQSEGMGHHIITMTRAVNEMCNPPEPTLPPIRTGKGQWHPQVDHWRRNSAVQTGSQIMAAVTESGEASCSPYGNHWHCPCGVAESTVALDVQVSASSDAGRSVGVTSAVESAQTAPVQQTANVAATVGVATVVWIGGWALIAMFFDR
jgi:hypothetical protein